MSGIALVINAGSSSLKCAVFDLEQHSLIFEALAERLYQAEACISFNHVNDSNINSTELGMPNASHGLAIKAIIEALGLTFKPTLIGHRVVHGGEFYSAAIKIDAQVKAHILACATLAPLHNPANLDGIEAAESLFNDIPQYAIFDTAFHNSLPKPAFLYALPIKFYKDMGVRRYGFHGTSHEYVSAKAAKLIQQPIETLDMVVAHLGNGCSATAIGAGKSLDTTMGFTPLDGLVMGTRSGSLDPSILTFLAKEANLSIVEIDEILNKQSGLLGLSELSNDMRSLEKAMSEGHKGARLAIQVFCFRLAKAIASLVVSLQHFDALIFTGGIGENSSLIREKTCQHLRVLGISIDRNINTIADSSAAKISSSDSSAQVWVVATNEELMIAQQAQVLFEQERQV
jgi:acetate kinase